VEYQASLRNGIKPKPKRRCKIWDCDCGTGWGFFSDQVLGPIMQMRIRMQTSNDKCLPTPDHKNCWQIWILRVCGLISIFNDHPDYLFTVFGNTWPILRRRRVNFSPLFGMLFTTWIARFVSVNLYVGVAYLIPLISPEGFPAINALEVKYDK